MKISTIITTSITAVAIVFSSSTFAKDTKSVVEAKKIIQSYKDLRATCSKTEGDDRITCFSKLNDANEEYVAAKQYIRQTTQEATDENDTAAHRVTFL